MLLQALGDGRVELAGLGVVLSLELRQRVRGVGWYVLLGIFFLAVNLRTAVAALSPIVPYISADIPLDSVGLGVLGMLPPIAFAVSAAKPALRASG